MSRLLKKSYDTSTDVALPVIDWSLVGAEKPEQISLPDNQLPQADVAIITWTSAEWSALDHVFLNSDLERKTDDYEWREYWRPLTVAGQSSPILYYQNVSIKKENATDKVNVLLVKSEVHLAHSPYIKGVEQLTDLIISQSKVSTIISSGTAGGSTTEQALGDVVLTTAASIRLEKTENTSNCSYNNQTFTGTDFFVDGQLFDRVKNSLMMPLNTVWNTTSIEASVTELNKKSSTSYTADDLVNAPLVPSALSTNQIEFAGTQPLLTTDYYFIAQGSTAGKYCFLEMDDAVIAHQCQTAGIRFGFIRNVSDPVVASTDTKDKPIPEEVREDWSGIIYSLCGFYTTYNSALTCWAAVRCNL